MFTGRAVTCYREIAELDILPVLRKSRKRLVAIAPARADVARESLRFLDADIGIGAESDQFVGSIAENEAAVSPMIR
jgi:hypothetical protein